MALLMLGAVYWCDRKENKAVIFCEDLAGYVFARMEDPQVSFAVGDLFEFDVQIINNSFHARNMQRVSAVYSRPLAENRSVHIRQNAGQEGKIVLFKERHIAVSKPRSMGARSKS